MLNAFKNSINVGLHMKASGLGERGIIDLIWSILGTDHLNNPANLILPPPDDASALKMKDGTYLVLKTDMFVKRTDAPKGMKHSQMGFKALAMNVSDLAAKGAKPIAFMFSLGIPKNYDAGKLRSLICGLKEASIEYSAPILGGDVGEAKDLIVSGFLAGYTKSLVKRSGASPGDIIAVTGSFGDTASAFKILLEGKEAPPELKRSICNSVYNPKAKLALGLAMAESDAASSSMDSSDGLAFTLNGIAKASRVCLKIDRLPISKNAVDFGKLHRIDPKDLALFGGEEYEIVYTIKKEMWDSALSAAQAAKGQLIEIGKVARGGGVYLKGESGETPIPEKGWEHLKG